MSIETTLKDLTAALEESTATNKRLCDLLEKGQSSGATTSATKKAPAKKAPAKKAPAKKAPAKKKATIEDLKLLAGKYLKKTDDQDEIAERRDDIVAINNHFGVKVASNLDAEDIPEYMGYLKALDAGETPDFMNEEDAADDEDGLI